MARPIQSGLNYFAMDVDFFTRDEKILDLKHEYGPVGLSVYISILCKIYANGYYLKRNPDKLASDLVEVIGSKFIRKDLAQQVILFCGHIGLFDDALLHESVFTSVSIQKRYLAAKRRSKGQPDKEEYWLLKNEKDEQPLLNAPKNEVIDTKNGVIVAKTEVNATIIPIKEKKSKVNNNIVATPKELPTFSDTSFEMKCVEEIIKSCLDSFPNSKVPVGSDKQKWCSDIEKMIRIDKRTKSDIQRALDYALHDSFWKTNIRSARKFREKFETLIIQSCGKKTCSTNKFNENFNSRNMDFDNLAESLIRN